MHFFYKNIDIFEILTFEILTRGGKIQKIWRGGGGGGRGEQEGGGQTFRWLLYIDRSPRPQSVPNTLKTDIAKLRIELKSLLLEIPSKKIIKKGIDIKLVHL